jgi:hypothetical protein
MVCLFNAEIIQDASKLFPLNPGNYRGCYCSPVFFLPHYTAETVTRSEVFRSATKIPLYTFFGIIILNIVDSIFYLCK